MSKLEAAWGWWETWIYNNIRDELRCDVTENFRRMDTETFKSLSLIIEKCTGIYIGSFRDIF